MQKLGGKMLKPLSFLTSGLLFLLIVSLLIPVNSGCKTKTVYDTTYIHDTITISKSSVFLGMLYDDGQQGILVSDPIADIAQSQLQIGWGKETTSVFPYEFTYPGYIGFMNVLYLSAGTNYKLTLTSNIGSTQGTVKMPDMTTITQPTDWQVIPIGQITCLWTDASVSYYEAYYYIDGYDNNGGWVGGIEKDTFVSTNSFILPAGLFNMSGAVRYEVDFEVQPFEGPLPSPGVSGNMTGTIKGFLVAYGDYDYIYFYVGSAPLKTDQRHERKQPSRQDHMNAYLKQLGVEQVIE